MTNKKKTILKQIISWTLSSVSLLVLWNKIDELNLYLSSLIKSQYIMLSLEVVSITLIYMTYKYFSVKLKHIPKNKFGYKWIPGFLAECPFCESILDYYTGKYETGSHLKCSSCEKKQNDLISKGGARLSLQETQELL